MKNQLGLLLIALLSFAAPVGCTYEVVIDSDGDTVPDSEDVCPDDRDFSKDKGECGCNYRKIKDRCVYMSVSEESDLCPDDPNKTGPGFCGCGTPDTDTDNDGTPDCMDQCPKDPNKTEYGICGCDQEETDTDKDGVPDCIDQCPNDANKTEPGLCGCGNTDTDDADNDGTPDCVDECPDDHNKTEPGICGCGKDEKDTDNDGTPDCVDECPDDPNKIESGLCKCGNPDTDSEGNLRLDCGDLCPNDPNKTDPGFCGCGIPDTDLNDNGIADCLEKCLSSSIGKETHGICGCDKEEDTTDSDKDGTPDCIDKCPQDPNKIEPGVCKCGTPDTDSDGDDVPDCYDACPYDATRSKADACGCHSAGTATIIDDKEVCLEEGGVLQGGLVLRPPDTPTHLTMMEAFNNRTVSSLTIRLTYAPAGNLLYNPALEYNADGWDNGSNPAGSPNYGSDYNYSYDDNNNSRPFDNYPCLWSYKYGSSFSQEIKLPKAFTGTKCTSTPTSPSDIACTQKLMLGVFARTQPESPPYYHGNDPVIISLYNNQNTKKGELQKTTETSFQLFAYSINIDLNEAPFRVTFTGKDGGGWGGYYGAGLQYFSAYLGDREIRFSNDGKKWTAWEKFSPKEVLSSAGYRPSWNLEQYGGNAEPGLKTVYMQTHDLLTDKYYQISDTFKYEPAASGE